MADVIWSPSTNHNSGPGVNIPSSNSVGSYDGGTSAHSSSVYSPSYSPSSNKIIKEENERQDQLFSNVMAGTGFDVNAYFDAYSDFMNDHLKAQAKYNDEYLEKYMRYNQDLYKSAQDFEKMMSDTAIQRQVQDMIKAGINPVLASQYQGASVPSVSAPYVSVSPSSALGSSISGVSSAFGSGLNAMSSIYASQMSRGSALDVASLNNSTQYAITNMISERDYRLASMANANAIYIHNLDNTAKAELEHSLQNEKFKHEYDVLDQQLYNDLTRYAEQHNYNVDLQDKQLINQWIAYHALPSNNFQGQIVKNIQHIINNKENRIAYAMLDQKYGGVFNTLFNANLGN